MSRTIANQPTGCQQSPANLPAERAVLGALIEDDGLVPEVLDAGLLVDDFLLSDHQRIFLAIVSLSGKHCPVDYVTVAEHLGNRSEDYALIGGLIQGVVLHQDHVLHHVAIVRRKAKLRTLLKLGEWILGAVLESSDPGLLAEEISNRLERCR